MVGDVEVLPGVTLVQCGGHFPGSAVLHWAAGAGGRGVLLTGDTIFVTPGEDRVTFVFSAPNRLPLSEAAVRGVAEAVRPLRSTGSTAAGGPRCCGPGAWETVRRSALRYIEHLDGPLRLLGRRGEEGWGGGHHLLLAPRRRVQASVAASRRSS